MLYWYYAPNIPLFVGTFAGNEPNLRENFIFLTYFGGTRFIMNNDDMQTHRFHSLTMLGIGIILVCIVEVVFRLLGI